MRWVAALVVVASVAFGSTRAGAETDSKEAKGAKEAKTEVGVVPLLGGDSDIGIGGGELSTITRHAPGYEPYLWSLDSAAILTVKPPTGSDSWRFPYQDIYLKWTVPELIPKHLRLEVRPSYTRETTQAYYGIGNASQAPEVGPEGQAPSAYFQYGRMHPTLLVRLRVTLGKGLYFLFGNYFTYNRIDVHPDSKLARDIAADSTVGRFFGPLGDHGVDVFEYGVVYDTRDDETSPHSGAYHQVKLRLSPGGTSALPYRYGQVSVITRFYATLVPRRLELGLRFVGDGQFGNSPFYELARYEDTFAFGGGNGVRGVPGQRYYGKVKVFGNIEARSELVQFAISGKDYSLGLVGFFDGGRLWADWKRNPSLDGDGAGLKYGVGGGIRFQQGTTFVVRGDVAWSPDSRPVGAYVTAGQTF